MWNFQTFKTLMEASTPDVELMRLYQTINTTVFDNRAPKDIPVRWGGTGSKQTIAVTTYKVRRQTKWHDPVTVPGSITIIVKPMEFQPDVLKGILAHEMIHAIIANESLRDYGMHGPRFIAMLEVAKKKADFMIPIKHITPAEIV